MKKFDCRRRRVCGRKQSALVFTDTLAAKCLLFGFLLAPFWLVGCSIPNLESQDCTAARQTVKDFYSFHFGNDMKMSKENLQQRAKFLSAELKRKLENRPEQSTDYFTATDDFPKAFRAGQCEVVEPNKKTIFQVLLFWKDEKRTEQREIRVEVVNESDAWLISDVR